MPPRLSPEVEASLKQHVEQQKHSELNKRQYCRQHNLNYDQFQYMSRKTSGHKAASPTETSRSSNLVPVLIQPPKDPTRVAQNTFTLTRANGSRLEWTCDWSSEQVAHFIAQWEGGQ